MPRIRMLERRDESGGRRASKLRRRRLLETLWYDPVDPATIVAAVQILEPLDRFRNTVGEVQDLPVQVGDIQRAIRAVGEGDWPEPEVGRCQEFLARLVGQTARAEAYAVRRDAPVMHQIVAGDADVDILPVLRRKRAAAIKRDAARADQVGRRLRRRAGEYAFRAPAIPHTPPRIFGTDAVDDL